jgi:hypothetical protein
LSDLRIQANHFLLVASNLLNELGLVLALLSETLHQLVLVTFKLRFQVVNLLEPPIEAAIFAPSTPSSSLSAAFLSTR